MLFSIILPIYNVEKYLNECVDSILNQTFTDYELILVDDGSTDASPVICDAYAAKDERIKVYIQENNLGYIKNFEFLLKESTSNCIMYADHDDIWYENKVEKSLEELIKNEDFRRNKEIYAQIIDDEAKTTLCSASTLDKSLKIKNGS